MDDCKTGCNEAEQPSVCVRQITQKRILQSHKTARHYVKSFQEGVTLQWLMLAIPTFRKHKQEDREFRASLSYILSPKAS